MSQLSFFNIRGNLHPSIPKALTTEQNFKNYLKFCHRQLRYLSEDALLIVTYLTDDSDDLIQFEKVHRIQKELILRLKYVFQNYSEDYDDSKFDKFLEDVTVKIVTINDILKKHLNNLIPKTGTLPFKRNQYYWNRNGQYKVVEKTASKMTIIENGLKKELSIQQITIREKIHAKIIEDHHRVVQILSDSIDAYKTFTSCDFFRVTHCHHCSATNLDAKCKICYKCGWYICPHCSACGCGYSWRKSN